MRDPATKETLAGVGPELRNPMTTSTFGGFLLLLSRREKERKGEERERKVKEKKEKTNSKKRNLKKNSTHRLSCLELRDSRVLGEPH